MKSNRIATLILAAVPMLIPAAGSAHCDTMDGPVVIAGKSALEKGDLTPALMWLRPEGENEVRAAFQKTLAVRALGGEAKDLADRYFLETYVRVHRAGEGAGFEGLKPAGSVEPAIALADRALTEGSADALARAVNAHVDEGIQERFRGVMEAGQHAEHSVEAGRAYVAAYVDFIHYVERVHGAAVSSAVAAGSAAEGHGAACGHK